VFFAISDNAQAPLPKEKPAEESAWFNCNIQKIEVPLLQRHQRPINPFPIESIDWEPQQALGSQTQR
jgi:hypothetical protein